MLIGERTKHGQEFGGNDTPAAQTRAVVLNRRHLAPGDQGGS